MQNYYPEVHINIDQSGKDKWDFEITTTFYGLNQDQLIDMQTLFLNFLTEATEAFIDSLPEESK